MVSKYGLSLACLSECIYVFAGVFGVALFGLYARLVERNFPVRLISVWPLFSPDLTRDRSSHQSVAAI